MPCNCPDSTAASACTSSSPGIDCSFEAIRHGSQKRMVCGGGFHPTLHLEHVAPECGEINYITGAGRTLDCELAMSNNFAVGGINTSLMFRRI